MNENIRPSESGLSGLLERYYEDERFKIQRELGLQTLNNLGVSPQGLEIVRAAYILEGLSWSSGHRIAISNTEIPRVINKAITSSKQSAEEAGIDLKVELTTALNILENCISMDEGGTRRGMKDFTVDEYDNLLHPLKDTLNVSLGYL